MYSPIYRWLGMIGMMLVCSILIVSYGYSADTRGRRSIASDSSLRLYKEAITTITKHAPQPLSQKQIVRDTLKAYLRSLDPFSDYLLPDEYANFRALQQPHYAGVGMDLLQTRMSQIVCIPYPDGPAAQAGIVLGDVLQAVNGVDVEGQSVLTVGTKIRGKAGSPVDIRVVRQGIAHDVHLVRTALQARTVFVEQRDGLPIVRVVSFTEQTPHELLAAFTTLSHAPAVILDLRGNTGGSLQGAIDAAQLFLAHGKQVVRIKTQEGLKEFSSDRHTPITVPLYVWQDTWTASAAEVFIAALRHHQRAVSLGKTTFGKGIMQQFFELSDGSALLFTTGYLQPPHGVSYHNRGLEPMYPLAEDTPETGDYVGQTSRLLKRQDLTSLSVQLTQPTAQVKTIPPVPLPGAASPRLSEIYLVCFDKDFDTEASAQAWSTETRLALKTRFAFYALQRLKPTGIMFMVCLGPFLGAADAEKQQPMLVTRMKTEVFTITVGQTSAAPSQPEHGGAGIAPP